MKSSLSSPRIGTLLSLVGAALIILGFFLPMFNYSNPQVPGSIHPLYEWQVVAASSANVGLAVLFAVLAALPLLGMLLLLIANGTELFQVPLSRLTLLKRVGAAGGLVFQLLFDTLMFEIFGIGYGRVDIAPGLVVVLIGFVFTCVAAFILV